MKNKELSLRLFLEFAVTYGNEGDLLQEHVNQFIRGKDWYLVVVVR